MADGRESARATHGMTKAVETIRIDLNRFESNNKKFDLVPRSPLPILSSHPRRSSSRLSIYSEMWSRT